MSSTPSQLPTPTKVVEPADTRFYLERLVRAITNELRRKLSAESPARSLLLASPNGSVYTVTVDDTGTLETTLVYDAS